jgi:serine/threonine protein kinase
MRRKSRHEPVPSLVPDTHSPVTLYCGTDAVLYQARRASDDASVVVKLLGRAPEVNRRTEHDLWDTLSAGPGIQPLLRTGTTEDGRPYLLMEHSPDGSYEEVLGREGPVSAAEAVRVGVAVAEALAAVHDMEMLHHAVTPANVLRTPSGPALIDFGSALPPSHPFPPVYYSRATLRHAPPEEARGEEPGPASDVYRLASTVWTLLEGRAPFDDADAPVGVAEYRARLLTVAPPALSREDVPDQLAAVLRRAMDKDPGRRPASAQEFADELRGVRVAPAPSGRELVPDTDPDTATVLGTEEGGSELGTKPVPEPSAPTLALSEPSDTEEAWWEDRGDVGPETDGPGLVSAPTVESSTATATEPEPQPRTEPESAEAATETATAPTPVLGPRASSEEEERPWWEDPDATESVAEAEEPWWEDLGDTEADAVPPTEPEETARPDETETEPTTRPATAVQALGTVREDEPGPAQEGAPGVGDPDAADSGAQDDADADTDAGAAGTAAWDSTTADLGAANVPGTGIPAAGSLGAGSAAADTVGAGSPAADSNDTDTAAWDSTTAASDSTTADLGAADVSGADSAAADSAAADAVGAGERTVFLSSGPPAAPAASAVPLPPVAAPSPEDATAPQTFRSGQDPLAPRQRLTSTGPAAPTPVPAYGPPEPAARFAEQPRPTTPFPPPPERRNPEPVHDWTYRNDLPGSGPEPRGSRIPAGVLTAAGIVLVVVTLVLGGFVALRSFSGSGQEPVAEGEGGTDGSTRGQDAQEGGSGSGAGTDLAPTGVELSDESFSVSLTWTDNSGGETPHVVVGGPVGAAPTTMADSESGTATVTISGLNADVDYCFRVVAVQSADVLAPSGEVCTDRGGTDGGS